MVVVPRRRRLRLPDLPLCRCPLLCLWNFTLPRAVTLTLFFIPLWVFAFGTSSSANINYCAQLRGAPATTATGPMARAVGRAKPKIVIGFQAVVQQLRIAANAQFSARGQPRFNLPNRDGQQPPTGKKKARVGVTRAVTLFLYSRTHQAFRRRGLRYLTTPIASKPADASNTGRGHLWQNYRLCFILPDIPRAWRNWQTR